LKRLVCTAVIAFTVPNETHALECADLWSSLDRGCRRVVDTYEQGGNELLVSGYSYHIPGTWTPERRAQLNRNAWGLGWGHTVEDADGDTHTVFALAFRDSHKHLQAQVGYAYSTFLGSRDGLQPGIGYTVMIAQRPDLVSGVPFPVFLPLLSLRFREATLVATYIPRLNGGINHGSTLYVFGRYALY